VPGGFVLPYADKGRWVAARFTADGHPVGSAVPLPCASPAGIGLSGQTLACATLTAAHDYLYGIDERTGTLRWHLTLPHGPNTTVRAPGDVLYVTAPNATIAVRTVDGAALGRAPGTFAGAGPGNTVVLADYGQTSTTLTFYGPGA
jgi:hypothetical protein